MFRAHEARGPGNCSDSDTATRRNNVTSCNFDRDSERKNQNIKSVADSRLLVLEWLTHSSSEKNILTTHDNLFTLTFGQIPVNPGLSSMVATPMLNVADEDAQAVSQMC